MAQPVTLKGQPVQVLGQLPAVGRSAPSLTLTNADLQDIQLSEFDKQRKVLNIFPSIDTGTCATSVRKFNQLASELDNTVVLCVSMDLPFAQSRFCGGDGLENVITLSAFRHPNFLSDWGVAIADSPLQGLCARAIVVLDESDHVLHAELVGEIANEPDYDAALEVLK